MARQGAFCSQLPAATAGKIIRLTQMDRRKKEMEGKKERKKVEREREESDHREMGMYTSSEGPCRRR